MLLAIGLPPLRRVRRRLSRGSLCLAMAAAGLAIPLAGAAQMPEMIPQDPDMPRKDGFDAERAIFWAQRNFDPLRDPSFQSLADALDEGHVTRETPVLVFEAGGETLVLVTSQMSYHHVAQGEMAGEPWMVTF